MLDQVNWIAVLVCVAVGQIILTVWFTVLFGEPWAREYGATNKAQHTKEIPPYTYAIGLVSTFIVVLGLAVLQQRLDIDGIRGGLGVGVFVGLCFCVASALPGYAFLKRWRAFLIALSAQFVMVIVVSVILALWKL